MLALPDMKTSSPNGSADGFSELRQVLRFGAATGVRRPVPLEKIDAQRIKRNKSKTSITTLGFLLDSSVSRRLVADNQLTIPVCHRCSRSVCHDELIQSYEAPYLS
jgi:hypothetical protein